MANSSPFMAPGTYDLEAEQLRRRLAFADELRKQSETPLQGQMVSGHYVAPSWTQYLSQGLNQGLAAREERDAMKGMGDLSEKRRQESLAEALKISQAMNGTPAMPTGQSYETGANEMGDDSATVPQWQGAQAVNKQQALALMLGSKNPMFQQIGVQQMFKQPEYVVGERFNAETGRKEKVIYDKANPMSAMPFGGQEAVKGIAVNGQVVDPTKVGTVVPKQLEPDSILAPDGKGGFIPNQPVIQAKKEIAEAGRPNVNVRNDISTGKSLADQIGPIVSGTQAGAMGAVNQMNTINRLNSALNSGKVLAGPFANQRLALAQVGEMLGVGGKDNKEVLENTRTAIQSLAKFSLDGRSALKGQGQISDYEGKLLAKATSGDLSELTVPELRVLTDVASRVAKAQYQNHQMQLSNMRSRPDLAPLADFFSVPDLPQIGAPAQANPGAPIPASPQSKPTVSNW